MFVQFISEFGTLNNNKLLLKSGNTKIKKLLRLNLQKINKLKVGNSNTSFTILVDSLNLKTYKYTNLVLEKKKGKIRAFLVDYYPTRMWVAEYISGIVTSFDGKIGITKINLDEYSLKSLDCDYFEIFIDYLCPCHGHSVDDNCSCYIKPSRISYKEVVCYDNGNGGIPQVPTQTTTNNYSQGTPEGATSTHAYYPSSGNSTPDQSLTSTLLPYDNSNIDQITFVNDLLGIELGEVADIPIKNPNYIDLKTFLEEGKHVAWDKFGGSYYRCKEMWVYYRDGQYYVDQTGEGYWKKATLRTTNLSDELTHLIGTATKNAASIVLKYLTPAEEAYILLEGKDFDGLEQSQITNSVFLLLAVIPGTKVLKPVAEVTTAATRYFASIGGELLELVAEKGIAKFTHSSIKVLAKKATQNASKTKVMVGKLDYNGTFSYKQNKYNQWRNWFVGKI